MVVHLLSYVLNEYCYGVLIFVLYVVNTDFCKSIRALVLALLRVLPFAVVLIVTLGLSKNFVDWIFLLGLLLTVFLPRLVIFLNDLPQGERISFFITGFLNLAELFGILLGFDVRLEHWRE